ncbi:MAG: YceD family protein [Janthinobacterium lividum]
MRISPSDLIPDPMPLDVRLTPGSIEYAPDVRQTSSLHILGTAERIEEHRGPRDVVDDIRLRARFQGDFDLLCARCLDPILHRADQRFDLIFRPSGIDAEQGERSISEAETEIGYYEESGLLLEDVVREQVLLSLPDRSLCREDCKGLCPNCGENLNEAACTCGSARIDPRWSALQGLGSFSKS